MFANDHSYPRFPKADLDIIRFGLSSVATPSPSAAGKIRSPFSTTPLLSRAHSYPHRSGPIYVSSSPSSPAALGSPAAGHDSVTIPRISDSPPPTLLNRVEETKPEIPSTSFQDAKFIYVKDEDMSEDDLIDNHPSTHSQPPIPSQEPVVEKIVLSEEQQAVMDAVLRGESLFFTGSAGTGLISLFITINFCSILCCRNW